jgi:hypothetical protein
MERALLPSPPIFHTRKANGDTSILPPPFQYSKIFDQVKALVYIAAQFLVMERVLLNIIIVF